MPIYPTSTLHALATAWEQAGISLKGMIKANASIFAQQLEGTPAPIPQKSYPDGSTEQQQKCADVAYILYQIALLKPGVEAQDAKDDYCANHDGCFAE